MDSISGNAAGTKQEAGVPGKPHFKSYRKKFFKIRSSFGKVMTENNTLWDGEQNLRRVARRLEEELDQLRELLTDVNESGICPKHMLMNLNSSQAAENEWLEKAEVVAIDKDLERILHEKAEEYEQAEGYCSFQKEYRQELRKGEATLADYRTAYKTALPYYKITRSLGYLEEKVAHTRRDDVSTSSMPSEITEDAPLGYIGPQQEAEYLERLDADVAARFHTVANAPGLGPPLMPPPAANCAAKDNPMSALNWLRKHQPQDFPPEGGDPMALGDKAEDGAASSKKGHAADRGHAATPSHAAALAGTGSARRESGRAKRRGSAMHEVLDDEGHVIGHEPSSRGRGAAKRKRLRADDDDDVAYHPSKGTGRKKVRKSALELAGERD